MTTQQVTFLLPPYASAALTPPEFLTPDAFGRLDSAIGEALREPGRGGSTDATSAPGTIEYDSGLIHQH